MMLFLWNKKYGSLINFTSIIIWNNNNNNYSFHRSVLVSQGNQYMLIYTCTILLIHVPTCTCRILENNYCIVVMFCHLV